MMSFTTEEMTVLSAQMDEQLHALRDLEKHFKSGASKSDSQSPDEEQLLEKQRKEIKENAFEVSVFRRKTETSKRIP
jgi:hypothetical protein